MTRTPVRLREFLVFLYSCSSIHTRNFSLTRFIASLSRQFSGPCLNLEIYPSHRDVGEVPTLSLYLDLRI